MHEWTEIRRRVLLRGASKRGACPEYGIAHETLQKILSNTESSLGPRPRWPSPGPGGGDDLRHPPGALVSVRPQLACVKSARWVGPSRDTLHLVPHYS